MNLQNRYYEACVVCNTYNQSAYIEDALNGFALQKTSFPFVCVVVDDASSDGNKIVINNYFVSSCEIDNSEYEDTDDYALKFARHKDNVNCYFAVFFLKYNHYSRPELKPRKRSYYAQIFNNAKYIACCEGDDYWIHSCFLSTAVNFLNDNPEYSAVFGNKIVCDREGRRISKITFRRGLSIEDIMRGYNMGLRNLVFRKEIKEVEPFVGKSRDLYVYYQCAASGKLKYFDEDFAVYRMTGDGIYSKLNKKDAIRTSYKHYYNFHKAVYFKYQKDLVYYQVLHLLKNVAKTRFVLYTLSLIREYHAPSHLRYIWYFEVLINIIVSSIGKCIRNIVLRPKN